MFVINTFCCCGCLRTLECECDQSHANMLFVGMVIYASRQQLTYLWIYEFMLYQLMVSWFPLQSVISLTHQSLVERMQIHMVLQLLAIYGQLGMKCHPLSYVMFEIAGVESRFRVVLTLLYPELDTLTVTCFCERHVEKNSAYNHRIMPWRCICSIYYQI